MPSLLKLPQLFLATLTYLLGVSIADYFGHSLRADSFWLGLIIVVLSQISMNLLAEVFRPHNEPLTENETPQQKETLRNNMLYASIAFIATTAVIAILLFNTNRLSPSTFYFLLLSIIILLAYSSHPFRLLNRGFGEFLLAVQIAYIYPSIGFLLQADQYQSMLIYISIPLTLIALAYFLALNFVTFSADQKYQRGTLLRRITWEAAVPLHHNLLISAYLFLLAVCIFVLSFDLLWQAFLTIPFAILQIMLIRHISLGGKPNWTLLKATSLAVFGLTTYFLTITFWLR